MATGLTGRVERLEALTGGSASCPSCGHPPGAPVDAVIEIPDNGRGDREVGPDTCPACGRVLALRVTMRLGERAWADDEEE